MYIFTYFILDPSSVILKAFPSHPSQIMYLGIVKVIHLKYSKRLKEAAQHSHLGKLKIIISIT